MRAWENRTDTFVCDEPFYAYYLHTTGDDHPGGADIMKSYDTDWKKVVADLTGEIPDGKSVFFQKHMAHHILPDLDLSWLSDFRVGLLIRDPAEVITSYVKVRGAMTFEETGLLQQVTLYQELMDQYGRAPLILDSADVLRNPRGMLEAICSEFGIDFQDNMLRWPAGPRETDGIWAKYWYSQVEATTGFGEYRPRREGVPEGYEPMLERCQQLYETLHSHRLTA